MVRWRRSNNLGYSIGPVCAVRSSGSIDLESKPISRLAIDRVDDSQHCLLGLLDNDPIAFIPLGGFLSLGSAGLLLIGNGWSNSLIWILCAAIFT